MVLCVRLCTVKIHNKAPTYLEWHGAAVTEEVAYWRRSWDPGELEGVWYCGLEERWALSAGVGVAAGT